MGLLPGVALIISLWDLAESKTPSTGVVLMS